MFSRTFRATDIDRMAATGPRNEAVHAANRAAHGIRSAREGAGAALRFLAVAGALSIATACARADATRGGLEATVDTIGDTIVVRTTAGSIWGGPRTLVPEITIGVIDGDEAYMLGSINGIAVGRDGAIYAIDRQVPVLRKYGTDGIHIADFGRDGGGPGEYKNPDGGIAILRDGRIAVRDPGNARIQLFTPDGTPAGEWPLPSGGGFSTSRRLYVDDAGKLYVSILLERDRSVDEWKWGLAVIEPDGTHHDTIAVPTWDY
jgi:hypothetical protein